MKQRVVPILFVIIVLFFLPLTPSRAAQRLFVDDLEVELHSPLEIMSGSILIPIRILEEHLGARISVADGKITAVFPDQTILMRLGDKSALMNGETYELDVEPVRSQGDILVPLRFFADKLGFRILLEEEGMILRLTKRAPARAPLSFAELRRQERTELPAVVPVAPETQDLREIIFMGGPRSRVFLDVKSYADYQTNLLTDPPRLTLDLYGVEGAALPVVEVHDPLIQRIRSSRFDDDTMRIVFDLDIASGYTVTPWPGGGLEVEFNHRLFDAGLRERGGLVEVWVEASHIPAVDVIYLDEPRRLVVDIADSTLLGPARDVNVNYERISRLRMSQHSTSITRLVLELSGPMTALPLQEEGAGRFAIPLFPGTALEAASYTGLPAVEPVIPPAQQTGLHPDFGSQEDTEQEEGILSGLIIAVDPGHGGSDPGTIGYQGSFEKDISLAISRYLGEHLTQAGAEVVFTRESDTYVSIFARPEIAVQAGADAFVSIHVNSHIKRGTARGTETLYRANDPISERLARLVQAELVKAITLVDRRVWGRDDLAVFNGCQAPAILVEVGFLDHPDEEILLRAEGFQKVAAEGIYRGIELFFLEQIEQEREQGEKP